MKSKVEELAIWGAPPAFKQKLHVGRPNIGNRARLLERIGDVLDRRWLTNDGPFLQEFETRISERLGVKHCIDPRSGKVVATGARRASMVVCGRRSLAIVVRATKPGTFSARYAAP